MRARHTYFVWSTSALFRVSVAMTLLVMLSPLNAAAKESAEYYAALVQEWSEAIRSFKGQYTLQVVEFENARETVYPPQTMEYRLDGENRWIKSDNFWRPLGNRIEGATSTLLAIYDGKLSTRYEREEPPIVIDGRMYHARVDLNLNSGWPLLHMRQMQVDDIFRRPYDNMPTYAEIVREEKLWLMQRDGQTVLIPWGRGGIGVEIYFDEQNHIARIDRVLRLGVANPETMKELLPEFADMPFDVKVLNTSIKFKDCQNIDGLVFPGRISYVGYSVYAIPGFKTLVDEYEDGRISQAEYVRQMFLEGQSLTPAHKIELTYDVKSLEINRPMTAKDFEVPRESRDFVVDHAAPKEERTPPNATAVHLDKTSEPAAVPSTAAESFPLSKLAIPGLLVLSVVTALFAGLIAWQRSRSS